MMTLHNVDGLSFAVSSNRSRTDLIMCGLEHLTKKKEAPVSHTGLLGQMSQSCHMEAAVIAIFYLVNPAHVSDQPVINSMGRCSFFFFVRHVVIK